MAVPRGALWRLPTAAAWLLLLAEVLGPQAATAGKGECPWKLVWSDEFDGDALDLSKWDVEVDCHGGGNGEKQCYTARKENLYISNGNLVLHAINEFYTGSLADCTSKDKQDCLAIRRYTSARVRTLQGGAAASSWLHGRVAVRARVPSGRGLWPAIWMLPSDWEYGGWAASGEVDILEMRGQEVDRVQGTIWYGDQWPNQEGSGSGPTSFQCITDFSQDFHEFALEWGEKELVWYVDGVPYHRESLDRSFNNPQTMVDHYNGAKAAPFDRRFHLLVNLAVGGNFLMGPGPFDAWSWTRPRLEVDWVRVYQREDLRVSDPNELESCFGFDAAAAGAVGNASRAVCRAKTDATTHDLCNALHWACNEGGVSCDAAQLSCDAAHVRPNADRAFDIYYKGHKEQGPHGCEFGGVAALSQDTLPPADCARGPGLPIYRPDAPFASWKIILISAASACVVLAAVCVCVAWRHKRAAAHRKHGHKARKDAHARHGQGAQRGDIPLSLNALAVMRASPTNDDWDSAAVDVEEQNDSNQQRDKKKAHAATTSAGVQWKGMEMARDLYPNLRPLNSKRQKKNAKTVTEKRPLTGGTSSPDASPTSSPFSAASSPLSSSSPHRGASVVASLLQRVFTAEDRRQPYLEQNDTKPASPS
eukprot:jgi/Chlat1/4694/Chrsp3S05629